MTEKLNSAAQQAGTRLLCLRTTSYPVSPLSHTTIPTSRFGQLAEDSLKNINLIRNFSLNTSPVVLCFFGYSYIMHHVEYYPCGGAV